MTTRRAEELLQRLLDGLDRADARLGGALMPAADDDVGRARLYDGLVALLVRLLFGLIAEARGRLPLDAPGAGDAPTLAPLTRRRPPPDAWARICAHGRALAGGDPRLALGEGPGPLFGAPPLPADAPVDDRTVTAVVAGLSRWVPEVDGEEALGLLYESLLGFEIRRTAHGHRLEPGPVRKRRGSFYTPPALTARIVEATLGPLLRGRSPTGVLELRVCDPAMGAGAFLLQAARVLGRAAAGPDADAVPAARRAVIERCIHGVDRDPVAVELARLSLWLQAGGEGRLDVAAGLRHGDALLGLTEDRFVGFHWRPDPGPEPAAPTLRALLDAPDGAGRANTIGDLIVGACLDHSTDAAREAARRHRRAAIDGPLDPELAAAAARIRALAPLHWPVGYPAVARAGRGFDAIIANPPYRAGRHAGLTRMRPLLQGLHPTAEYQLDPYLLFLDRAIALTRPGGRVGMVVPNAWMSNHRTGRLRARMVRQSRLDHVLEVPVDAFDAHVETVVVGLEVGRPTTRRRVPLHTLDGADAGTLLVDLEQPERPIALARGEAAIALLEASRGWTTTLGDIATVTRGINPYHHTTHAADQIRDRVHHADHRVDDAWSPEIRGRHLTGPYRLEWPGDTWIHYGPWLKEPRDPAVFEGRRLLVRKIIGETLHGVLVDEPGYCDQSVYIARFAAGQPYDPWAVLACVVSRLMATLVKTRYQEDDRLFPQLKVGEFRSLPLPAAPPDDPRWATLAARARAAQSEGPSPARLARIEAEVEALYGIPAHR